MKTGSAVWPDHIFLLPPLKELALMWDVAAMFGLQSKFSHRALCSICPQPPSPSQIFYLNVVQDSPVPVSDNIRDF